MIETSAVVSNSNTRAWVDTVTDLNQYKPSQEELEQRKLARKSNNKLLAKVTIIRFRGDVEEWIEACIHAGGIIRQAGSLAGP